MKTASPARFARRSVVALGFAIAAASAAAGPIHHWDFEGDEFPFEDRVGSANGVGGDLVSLVDSGAPAIGQAIAVGAESALPDNGVAVPQAATPSFGTGSFSFAFWIRRIDAENVSSDGILDALAGTTEGYQMLVLDDSEQIRLRLDDSTGAVALLDSAFQFADTAWHHVAITVDRTAAEARFYLDGEFDVARDASAMVGTINASQGLQIGGINAGANGLDGELGDLRIFTHVLTPAEIADLFEPTPLPPTDLLLSASAVSTLAAAGDVAAILSAVDASLSDAHTFSLAAGAGDSDNARFVVEGGTLRFAAPVTEAAGAGLSLRLRVEDSSGLSFEKAVALTAEAPQLILNEFLASNQDGLEDEDGESSDWIELANAGQSHASLAGWSLADGAGEPWVMPARDLAPGGFALVFASGKDRAPDSGEWHASFALSIGGEALELRRPDGSPASAFLPGYPEQRADFSYGVGSGGGIGFLTPTPGAANGAVFPSLPPAVKFRERDPVPPLPGEDLTLVLDASPQGAASVTLHYRINYGPEQEIEMDHAGDIAFSATIPAAEYAAGDMVRWYAVANESLATEVREPPFATAESEAYYGTVVQDPAVATALPVLQWFTQSEAGADSSAGTRASALFRGRFYDNFFCRIRGASSASW
ncbi:MAG: LamG-like jellyroll fold domain-containing protein [Verrucomicrobiales bacterium]